MKAISKRGLLAAVAALTLAGTTQAAVMYGTPAAPYNQNFDTLPNTPENATLGASPAGWKDDDAAPPAGNFSVLGWYLAATVTNTEGGFNGKQRMRIGAGTGNTGAYMSFGASTSTDRALGDVGSTTMAPNGADMYIGVKLTNTTGLVLDNFTLSYDGEQWRDGGNATPVAQTMTFGYSTIATAITSPNADFTSVPSLDFTSPIFTNTGSGAAVNGNTVGKTSLAGSVASGLNWLPGTDLWLRWDDISNPGNDHGLSIDNVVFNADVALPEPASLGLLSVGALGLLRRRK
jgi:hypothetical protein